MKTLKIILLGDRCTDKTTLLNCYVDGKPAEDIPTRITFELGFRYSTKINKERISFELYDTTGQEDYDQLRPLKYPGTDIFIVLFSIVDENSYNNVMKKWIPEIILHCSNVPFLLVGNGSHLRTDYVALRKMRAEKTELFIITPRMGDELARKIKAVKYLECSCKTLMGIRNIFYEAVWALRGFNPVEQETNDEKCCVIL